MGISGVICFFIIFTSIQKMYFFFFFFCQDPLLPPPECTKQKDKNDDLCHKISRVESSGAQRLGDDARGQLLDCMFKQLPSIRPNTEKSYGKGRYFEYGIIDETWNQHFIWFRYNFQNHFLIFPSDWMPSPTPWMPWATTPSFPPLFACHWPEEAIIQTDTSRQTL